MSPHPPCGPPHGLQIVALVQSLLQQKLGHALIRPSLELGNERRLRRRYEVEMVMVVDDREQLYTSAFVQVAGPARWIAVYTVHVLFTWSRKVVGRPRLRVHVRCVREQRLPIAVVREAGYIIKRTGLTTWTPFDRLLFCKPSI